MLIITKLKTTRIQTGYLYLIYLQEVTTLKKHVENQHFKL